MRFVLSCLAGAMLSLQLAGCSSLNAAEQSAIAAPAPATNPQEFSAWLADFRAEASAKGIETTTLDVAFAGVTDAIPRVLELDRSQPEFVQTFTRYMSLRMSDAR